MGYDGPVSSIKGLQVDALTDAMVRAGLITSDQLAVARVTLKNLGGDIGRILVKKGFVTEEKVREFVDSELHIPTISLKDIFIDQGIVKIIPLALCQKYVCIPIQRDDDTMTMAMANVMDLFAIDHIRQVSKCDINPVFASRADIEYTIRDHYHMEEASSVEDESVQVVVASTEGGSDGADAISSGAKIISTVNRIMMRAFAENASDIHIEPLQESVRVRNRVDGLLEERAVFPRQMHLPLITRLKVMSGMDIAERRVPQDGRVRLKIHGDQLDLRLSTYPTMHGEKMVIRLLARGGVIRLEDLGFSTDDRQRFVDVISKPHGIFLVTGPTGSGKTTTLYAALQRLNSHDKNIISIEDPIENEIVGVNQAQVNLKAGVTFASALRSILRQDPDVIMVGEIRDGETADISVRAAMTGHLVFSTLHTNTAVGAISRLVDLGVEPFLISSSLLGVIAQRLVRKTCPDCKCEHDVSPAIRESFGIDPSIKLYRGRGCGSCRMSGYRGRIGIYEIVVLNDVLKRMIAESGSEDGLRQEVRRMGVLDIKSAGVQKVIEGQTTIEEVIRVTQED